MCLLAANAANMIATFGTGITYFGASIQAAFELMQLLPVLRY
jgi:hypothetical protein